MTTPTNEPQPTESIGDMLARQAAQQEAFDAVLQESIERESAIRKDFAAIMAVVDSMRAITPPIVSEHMQEVADFVMRCVERNANCIEDDVAKLLGLPRRRRA